MLTREKALSIYDYCPISGVVTSKINRRQAKIGTVLGSPHGTGYLTVWYVDRNYFLHRVIWLMVTGRWPEQIDHVNGNRGDNSWENLRDVSQYINSRNMRLRDNNTSGTVGVVKSSSVSKPWRASIVCNYKQISLGNFRTYEEAVEARKKAEVFYKFHENHGRIL